MDDRLTLNARPHAESRSSHSTARCLAIELYSPGGNAFIRIDDEKPCGSPFALRKWEN